MYILLVVMWLTLPFMSWGFVIPATIIFRSIFVDLLGENVSLHCVLFLLVKPTTIYTTPVKFFVILVYNIDNVIK